MRSTNTVNDFSPLTREEVTNFIEKYRTFNHNPIIESLLTLKDNYASEEDRNEVGAKIEAYFKIIVILDRGETIGAAVQVEGATASSSSVTSVTPPRATPAVVAEQKQVTNNSATFFAANRDSNPTLVNAASGSPDSNLTRPSNNVSLDRGSVAAPANSVSINAAAGGYTDPTPTRMLNSVEGGGYVDPTPTRISNSVGGGYIDPNQTRISNPVSMDSNQPGLIAPESRPTANALQPVTDRQAQDEKHSAQPEELEVKATTPPQPKKFLPLANGVFRRTPETKEENLSGGDQEKILRAFLIKLKDSLVNTSIAEGTDPHLAKTVLLREIDVTLGHKNPLAASKVVVNRLLKYREQIVAHTTAPIRLENFLEAHVPNWTIIKKTRPGTKVFVDKLNTAIRSNTTLLETQPATTTSITTSPQG